MRIIDFIAIDILFYMFNLDFVGKISAPISNSRQNPGRPGPLKHRYMPV